MKTAEKLSRFNQESLRWYFDTHMKPAQGGNFSISVDDLRLSGNDQEDLWEQFRQMISRERTVSVITVRMPPSLHERLKALAVKRKVSLNQLCADSLHDAAVDLESP